MQIKSYEDAVKYLESFIGKVRFEITPEFIKKHDPLERMSVLLSLLGNPQEKFKSVLVGGTSGKGSTAYLISYILTTAGYKTGLTISPHLQKINERIQINGKSISDKKFTKMAGSIVDTIELMKKMLIGGPSYFEILIAMAFLYFAKEKVDIAVVEVGMGGEFDATNTLYPLIAVLTNISLDHTNILGGTVQEIAKTKVGIIKKNQESRIRNQGEVKPSSSIIHDSSFMIRPIVVTGVKQPSVIKIVEDRCKKVGARLYRLHKDFDFKIKKERHEGTLFDVTTAHGRGEKLHGLQNLQLALLGKYQVENACLAVETVRQLADFGFKISVENLRKALKTAFFPGRFEVIYLPCHPEFILRQAQDGELAESISGSRYIEKQKKMLKLFGLAQGGQVQHDKEKTLVLDGAHNPTKMKAFLASLKKLYPKQKKIFVVGFKFDKDIPKMLKQITKVADKIIITEFDRATDMVVSSSADALKIKNQILKIKYGREVVVAKDSKKAIDKVLAMGQYNNSTIIVITGSLYLVGEIRNML